MKILLIAYAFPPLLEPQSLRWAYLTRELAVLGHKIDVLTIHLPKAYQDLLYLISPHIRIFRVYPGLIEGTFFKTKIRILGSETASTEKRRSPRFILLKFFYRLLRNFSNEILIPDLRTEWFPFAYGKLRGLVRDHKYDLVLSSHEPGIDHILGYFAKKWSGSRWIGDFGDPIVSVYTPQYRRTLDSRLEKFLLKHMDGVVVTNGRLKAKFLHTYEFLNDRKIMVLHQGFDATFSLNKTERNRVFTLSYLGAFYEDFRSPMNLANALLKLRDVNFKFVLAGRNELFIKYFKGLGKKFEYQGLIPHREALVLQQGSDLLINIANRQDYQIPGKGYEYLGAMTPILQISDTEDEYSRLIKQINRGFVVRNNEFEIADLITSLYHLWEKDELRSYFNLSADGVRDFSWQNLTHKFDQFLKNETAH